SSLHRSRDLLSLHSFPTRRSSDLFDLERDDQVERSQCATRNDQRIGLLRFRIGVGAQFEQNLLSCPALGNSFVAEAFGEGHIERSEEHTSELQSRFDLVCRLLLEK